MPTDPILPQPYFDGKVATIHVCTGSCTHNKDQACAPVDRRKKSSDVPAIPDVPQAAENILKSIAPEIEKLISREVGWYHTRQEQQAIKLQRGRNNMWIRTPAARKAQS